MHDTVVDDIRGIFDAPDRERAEARLEAVVRKYAESAPELASWIETNIPEGLTVLMLPRTHRKRLRTSNWLENLNGKVKKRTAVVGLFPGVESVLRLVSAVLMETDERWLTGKRYLNMNVQGND